MKKTHVLLIFLTFTLSLHQIYGQGSHRVVFYNVENLFDTRKDSLKNDGDFTPGGRLRWTEERYKEKVLKTGRVLADAGGGDFPTFIGLCEVENRWVLTDLCTKGVLADGGYEIVHKDSPDPRGIDVAFLYRKDCFELLDTAWIRPDFQKNKSVRTRDILYASGLFLQKDTLHFFVCHFPSMSGGEAASEWKREAAAQALKTCVNRLQARNKKAALIIMGDLNGKADRPAQKEVLLTRNSDERRLKDTELYNTSYYLLYRNEGSYKYQGNWQTIDHIIVSGVLLNGRHTFRADRRMSVFAPAYLQQEDKTHFGSKPWRTYAGPRYVGGYSDHLPIYLELR